MVNFFGSKNKKNEYFLEFDDATGIKSPDSQPAKPVEEKPAQPTPTPAEATPVAEKPAQPTPTPAEAKPVEEKPTKPAKAKKATTKPKAQPTTAEAPKPQPVPVTPTVTAKKNEPVVLFGPNYLLPTPTTARRRPGANMSAFLGMARQVKRR